MKIIRATTVPESLDSFCRGMLKMLSEKYEVVALSSPGIEMQTIGTMGFVHGFDGLLGEGGR